MILVKTTWSETYSRRRERWAAGDGEWNMEKREEG